MIEYVPFVAGVLASLILTLAMAVSVASVDYRFWPPGDDRKKFKWYKRLVNAYVVTILVTTFLTWNTGPLPWPESIAVGGPPFVAGIALAMWSAFDLGEDETRGKAGDLQTDGLYRYTRNPQVVGYCLVFLSLGFLTNSLLVGTLGIFGILWLGSTPFAEESWLHEQYGEAYEDYRNRVPRYLGIRSVRRLVGDEE